MFPSSDYLKDTMIFSKLTIDLFKFIPYKNKYRNSLLTHSYKLNNMLHDIGIKATSEAQSGKSKFSIKIFDHTRFCLLNENKNLVLTNKTADILYKKFNNIVVRKSKIIVSIFSRFGHNVELEVCNLKNVTNPYSVRTLIKFNLED